MNLDKLDSVYEEVKEPQPNPEETKVPQQDPIKEPEDSSSSDDDGYSPSERGRGISLMLDGIGSEVDKQISKTVEQMRLKI